jgi:integrase
MATKRKRKTGSWEYVVRRAGVLPRPLYLTFANEAEGDEYVRGLEAMLDRGVVPEEAKKTAGIRDIEDLVMRYLAGAAVSTPDEKILMVQIRKIGRTRIADMSVHWADEWVADMKRVLKRSPSTIRHHVGALSRAFDWAIRKGMAGTNPLSSLPKRYATYTPDDARAAGEKIDDAARNRRLEDGEEAAIRKALAGDIKDGPALTLLFDIALETGMRLREIYTLTWDQVDFKKRTIFLDKTKNGDGRQVPMSSVVVARLSEQGKKEGFVFPWWDGEPVSLERVTSRLSRRFGAVFANAGCSDLHFHDIRHEATCRVYEKTRLSDVQIARMMGWRGLKMAIRYASLRGSDLADQLW